MDERFCHDMSGEDPPLELHDVSLSIRDKYQDVIQKTYPDVEVVQGTEVGGDDHREPMRAFYRNPLTGRGPDISDEYRSFLQSGKGQPDPEK